ncbi:MAG: Na(+)-translocating NADH-quinone reductase subunit A [Gammaproteobacteria bacterium]|nr:Na(+)-translocating NADH-quinone reductase subunit A [Gammaproteobacteria bacterium]
MLYKINKGLELPLRGRPDQRIESAGEINSAAVLGADYVGLKPTMLVQQGDRVKEGTPLFEDKKNPGVIVCSPAAGTVSQINRGVRRALISVVINIEGDEAEDFAADMPGELAVLNAEQVRNTLQRSGLWVAFRTRPYGKVPAVDSSPNSIFINAMDSNPLAVDPQLIINENPNAFAAGVAVLDKLGVPVYLCQAKGATLPDVSATAARIARFEGPHPAGLSSTHIHFIDPVNAHKTVWSVGYQDVVAIGQLFTTGKLNNARFVAAGGPYVNSPRVFEARLGASIEDILNGRVTEGHKRVISGSVFNGHHAEGHAAYLGRYDNQVSVIEENHEREFMGWIAPGRQKFSALNVFISSLFKPKSFRITTSQNGSPRAIVPIGVFERVMPLDILPTPLIKSILVKDTDSAQELGCLELVEEDLALCSFVDPGKHDFGPVLRSTLTQIEREG